jgi:hypothetical protein
MKDLRLPITISGMRFKDHAQLHSAADNLDTKFSFWF